MKLNIKKLESERDRLGLSVYDFSEKLGLNKTTYGKIRDSESTTLKTINLIAAKLFLDPKDLLTN